MDLAAFQTTIQGLIKNATGFDNGHAIWANQTRSRPDRPFAELDVTLSDSASMLTEDTVADTGGTPAPGEEITLTSKEDVELSVQVRVFSSAMVGSTKAFNIAQKIRAYLGRDNVQGLLEVADIALADLGTVRDASIVLETEHEGRAILDLKFRVANLETELTTFIETATVETTIDQLGVPTVRVLTITEE